MEQKTMYLPVETEKELPTEVGWYSCEYGSDLKNFLWFDRGGYFINSGGVAVLNVQYWMKPVTGYFFTESELQEHNRAIADKAYYEGYIRCQSDDSNELFDTTPNG